MTSARLFSFLLVVSETDPQLVASSLESILAQTDPALEVCVVDDASPAEEVRTRIAAYEARDPRVRVRLRTSAAGPCVAANDALAMAEGDWVALVRTGDVVAPHALALVGAALETSPDADVLYTDHDVFDRPFHHVDAHLKPVWSPEALLSSNYVQGLAVFRRSVVRRAGGFAPDMQGAGDYDLLLRVTEATSRVVHVPGVVYHRRAPLPVDWEAGQRALEAALTRRGVDGWVEPVAEWTGGYQVRRRLTHEPLVSVVIPTAGAVRRVRGKEIRLVEQAVESLVQRTDYGNVEVVVVLSERTDPRLVDVLQLLCRSTPVVAVQDSGRFDYARAVNRGVARSSGELLLLLNDDVEAIRPDWLRLLVEAVQDPEVGAAGSRLLFEDGSVQHAGVAHHSGLPFHPHHRDGPGPGYYGEVALSRNYLAVTGACMMTPRAAYERVGGLSPLFPVNYNDIDYCLKLRQAGQRVVYVGQSVLHHYESSSRDSSVTTAEINEWHRWWGPDVEPDPFLDERRLPSHAP